MKQALHKMIRVIFLFSFKKSNEFTKYVYSKPYGRIQPYLIGFILGYAIYMKYRGPIKRRGWVSPFLELVEPTRQSLLDF